MAAKSKNVYVCSECGYESAKWYGKCPSCGEWNTLVEQVATPTPQNMLETKSPKHNTKANSFAPAKRKHNNKTNSPTPFDNSFLKYIFVFCIITCPLNKKMLSS